MLETVIELITPYAAFMLGQALHVSPVMAVIVTGLAVGARRARITTAQTRLQLHSVYQTVIFLLESVVFSLIGLELPTLIRDLSHAEAWLTEEPDGLTDRELRRETTSTDQRQRTGVQCLPARARRALRPEAGWSHAARSPERSGWERAGNGEEQAVAGSGRQGRPQMLVMSERAWRAGRSRWQRPGGSAPRPGPVQTGGDRREGWDG